NVPVPDPAAPTPQAIQSAGQRFFAPATITPPQVVNESSTLASYVARQEVLSTDYSTRINTASTVVASAPKLISTPIFSSAYASTNITWNCVQSVFAQLVPQFEQIFSSPPVASAIANVVVPAEKIFNFAEMGNPMAFMGDSLANFAEESAAVP